MEESITKLEERRKKVFDTNDSSRVFLKLCGTVDLQKSLSILKDMIILDALKRNNYYISTAAEQIHTTREMIRRVCTKYRIKVVYERHKQRIEKLDK